MIFKSVNFIVGTFFLREYDALMENNLKEGKLRILIVDDHAMFIDGIRSLLRKEENLLVVAEANSGEEAVDVLSKTEVDLVVTDISMPGMSGTELARTIKENTPEIKVLVLTMYNDREIINEILLTEAEGYILKNTGKQELLKAIDKITNGGTYYSNEVMEIILDNIKRDKVRTPDEEKAKELTQRELEILQLICEEYSTADIAAELFISPRTVETHRKHILQKTQAKTIVGLIKFALANKLVQH